MKKFLYGIFLVCISFVVPSEASWITSNPKISEESAVLGHIFRDSRGHFNKDTPENRALVEFAAESIKYRVATDNFGNELYLRTMPNGLQVWAEVREGEITNGGRNIVPMQWIPDDSKKGGHLIFSKLFTSVDSGDARFRGAVTINHLVDKNGFLNPLSPSHWGSRSVLGVEGQYGRILNLLDPSENSGKHRLLLPIESLTEKEALQIFREVAQGIYVYDAVPIFSLHFNQVMSQYPILFPHYRKTLVGQALAMLDYWMKCAVNGRYFEDDWIYSWESNQPSTHEQLFNNSHDFHTLCKQQGIPYRSLFDILGELSYDSGSFGINTSELHGSFRIVASQNNISKSGDVLSFEPKFSIEADLGVSTSPIVKAAIEEMSLELEQVLPQIPHLKKYVETLHLANFFSYYCITLKEQGLIPLLDRDNPGKQANFRGCPNLFPPIPLSAKGVVGIGLTDFIKFCEKTVSFQLRSIENMHSAQGSALFLDCLHEYLGEPNLCQIDFSTAVFNHCQKQYVQTKANFDQFFSPIGIGNSDNPDSLRQFLTRIESFLPELNGEEKREMEGLRQEVVSWYEDPCAYTFKSSGFFLSNSLDATHIQFSGGCTFPIHRDLHAEQGLNLEKTSMKSIEITFSEMEVKPWDNPKEVAKGYLFPPQPNYPLSDAKLVLLDAIQEEDTALFDGRKNELWMWEWNFCDPMGRFFVHHASTAQSGHFLNHMISKWATIDRVDHQGWTPLHYAAASGSTECISLLLHYDHNLLERRGDDGETALFIAVQNGKEDALNTLLENGANPNAKLYMGLTPLMWSILSGKEAISANLLSIRDIDLAYRTFHGETALELAIQSRSLTTLQMLLAREVEVNRYHKGMTPLHLAAYLGWSEGVELLLAHPRVESTLLTLDGKSYLELLDCAQNAI